MVLDLFGKNSIKRLKTFFITIIMLAGLTISVSGQIKAARNEMAQYNYPKAIEILHQFIQKADPKTKSEATLLMADCYRLEYDMQDARAWYFKAIKLGNTQPLTYFYYAKALRACGEYESAKKIFLQYDSLMPDDHRGKIYASFCDSAMAWDEKPFAFEVNNARNLNSASSEFGPIFYNDGVVFATDKVMSTEEEKKSGWAGHGYLKLVFANPKQQEDYYGDYNLPRLIPELYTNGSNDGPATFSKDGNEVFITRTIKSSDKSKDEAEEGPSNQLKIYTATKAGDKWSKLRPFFFNSNNYSVGYPALSPDDNSLYFVSDVDGGYGGTDIYVTSRENGNWSKPENLGPIVNTFGDETFPFVADNGDLYFASDGHPGYGGLDIFVTRKVGNVWLNPQNLGKPINSSYDDFALAMYKNDSVGLFSANRPGGRGEDDIYSFRVVGPLPTLTSQPAIAAVQNPPKQQESRPQVKEERQVSPPSPEKVVPVPAPVTAEVLPPAQQQTTEIKPEVTKQQETQPAVTSEAKVPPPSPEKVVPVPEPATAEVTPPAQQQTTEIKPEVTKQQETQPAVTSETKNPPPSPEKVIPMPERATAEVTPPAQQQTIEIKPEVTKQQETQPAVTSETKNPSPSPEKVIPMPERATAEVMPPAQQQTTEIKPEVTKQQETQSAVAAETKEPPPSSEKVIPMPERATAEVTPSAQQQTTEIKSEVSTQQEPQPTVTAETKEPPPSPEKVVPVPEPVTAEVTPPAQQQTTEIKPEVTKQQETQLVVNAETKVPPPSPEKVVPVPEPVTAEVTPPAQRQTTEIKPEVAKQQETQLVVNAETKVSPPSPEKVVPIPAQVITEAEPNLPQPQTGKVSGTIIAESTLQKVIVSGCIKDRSNNVVIPSATIFFLNEKNGKVYVHKTNSTGCFKSELISGIDYKVKAMQTGYLSDCIPYSSPVSNTLAEATLSNDLLLDNAGVMQTYKIENIYYDFDRYFIRPDAEPTLKKLIRIMNEIPITVELGSHADCRGSDAYNMILTEKRANSAFQYIVKGGIDGSRIIRHWYGKTQLTNNCNCAEGVHCTEAQHQANRRTEFKISVPSSIMQETAIDLEKYHDGDTLDLHFLPADFFENCNHRLIRGPLAELLKSTSTMPEEQKPGVLYTVQIGAFSFITPHFTSLNEVMSCRGSDGILRCFVGKFSTKQEAIWYRDHLRASDFKDAFVTEMDSKHNPSISGQISYLSLQ